MKFYSFFSGCYDQLLSIKARHCSSAVGSGTVKHNFCSGYWLTTGIRKMDECSELGYAWKLIFRCIHCEKKIGELPIICIIRHGFGFLYVANHENLVSPPFLPTVLGMKFNVYMSNFFLERLKPSLSSFLLSNTEIATFCIIIFQLNTSQLNTTRWKLDGIGFSNYIALNICIYFQI